MKLLAYLKDATREYRLALAHKCRYARLGVRDPLS